MFGDGEGEGDEPGEGVADGTARQEGSDARMNVPLLQAVPAGAGCTAVGAPFTHWTKDDEQGESGRRASNRESRKAASTPVQTQ